jgi:hypothetical protein
VTQTSVDDDASELAAATDDDASEFAAAADDADDAANRVHRRAGTLHRHECRAFTSVAPAPSLSVLGVERL